MMPMDMRPEGVQRMMLTAKMLLNMHVLQLNTMDLRTFLQAELEENPLLEEEDSASDTIDEDESRLDEEISELIDEKVNKEELASGSDGERSSVSEEKKSYLESLITKKESLYDHLHWQLEVLSSDDEQKRIGEYIIRNLDDNGYLREDLRELPEILNVSTETVRSALSLIRTFDPAGVGGRDLKESLLIQLINFGKGDTHLYRIVYWHLEDLEKGNFEKIAQALSITIREVESAKKRILHLTPNPGAAFSKDVAVQIAPDVIVNKNNGSYDIEINDRDLPRIYLSPAYSIALKDKRVPSATKEYVRKKLFHARWVIDAVKQRKNTINRVCGYLVDKQKDFFDDGDVAAKPLTLKEAAETLSISEATVSRTVSNKYLQAPDRLFSLKSFFAKGIKQDSGMISTMSIKLKIKELLDGEDKAGPLKDLEIQTALREQGINISRRTVAKYRDDLKLSSATMRRDKREFY